MNPLILDFAQHKSQLLKLKKYTSNMSILLAEDYKELHDSLIRTLTSLFKRVDGAYDGAQAIELYKKNSYDLVLSDISMPNIDGLELSKRIKEQNPQQNIIILSAHKDAEYLHQLINIGVRRFIQKPVSLEKLIEEFYTVCSTLYSEQEIKNNIILSKNSIYKLHEKQIIVDNVVVNLTKYEEKLLSMLIDKRNQNISAEEVVNAFYLDGIDISLENVRKQIYKLRKKLPQELIENIHGVGYKIVSDT